MRMGVIEDSLVGNGSAKQRNLVGMFLLMMRSKIISVNLRVA